MCSNSLLWVTETQLIFIYSCIKQPCLEYFQYFICILFRLSKNFLFRKNYRRFIEELQRFYRVPLYPSACFP